MKFQFIEVSGSDWKSCGIQYGSQARDKIICGIADYKKLFSETSDKSWEQIQQRALAYLPQIEKHMPDVLEEAAGIAEGAGVSLADIMVLNSRYEITKFPKPNECTLGTVLPEAARDGAHYLCKNWDYRVGIMENIVLLRITQPDGVRILGISEAGQLLRDGMNTHGLALVNSNLTSVNDTDDVSGIPTCFIRRKTIKSASFAEAKELLTRFPRSVSCNMMLTSADGSAMDFEVHPGGTDTILPSQGVLTHANHFVVRPGLNPKAKGPRDARLRELLMQRFGTIDVPHIQFCLSDHLNGTQSLCHHPEDALLRIGRREITVASEIYDLKNREAYFCAGPPCSGEFVKYQL